VAAAFLVFATSQALTRVTDPGTSLRPGDPIALRGIDWQANDRTMIFALQPNCGPTEDTLPLVRDILASILDSRIHAVLLSPHTLTEARAMAADYHLAFSDVRQQPFASLKIPGSPTLLLVDNRGRLVQAWVGALSRSAEDDIFGRLAVTRVKAQASPAPRSADLSLSERLDPTAVVVDARPRDQASPIAGAISVPLQELEVRLPHEAPRNQPILVVCGYCRTCIDPRLSATPTVCDLVDAALRRIHYDKATLVGTVELTSLLARRPRPS
jgi:hypothetical protein